MLERKHLICNFIKPSSENSFQFLSFDGSCVSCVALQRGRTKYEKFTEKLDLKVCCHNLFCKQLDLIFIVSKLLHGLWLYPPYLPLKR